MNRFNELSFQLLSLQAHKANNSGYLRDARVIARVEKVAQAVRMGRDYKDSDAEIFYYRTMLLVYLATNTNDITQAPSRENECTVDTGLINVRGELWRTPRSSPGAPRFTLPAP
jgi:hypothetical protein